jgi:hypothetical protein
MKKINMKEELAILKSFISDMWVLVLAYFLLLIFQ